MTHPGERLRPGDYALTEYQVFARDPTPRLVRVRERSFGLTKSRIILAVDTDDNGPPMRGWYDSHWFVPV